MVARIAIVDDDPLFIELLQEILEYRGWETLPCHDPLRAVENVRQGGASVVLLDVRLSSVRSGWDILAGLKEDSATAAIPVILCSAATDEIRAHAPVLATRDILVLLKPFDIEDLYERVESALAVTAA